jgi:hypothetical protein
MAMHRKNSTKHVGDRGIAQPWFNANLERQRNRKRIAKASRRKNRK